MTLRVKRLLATLLGVVLALVAVLGATPSEALAVEAEESFITNKGGKDYVGTHFTISGAAGGIDGLAVGWFRGTSGNTVTVFSPNGESIERIVATVGFRQGDGHLAVNNGTLSGGGTISVTNVNATSVTFDLANPEDKTLVQLKSWTIYYEGVDVSGVALDPSASQTIDVGGSVRLQADVLPDDAAYKTVVWSVGGTDSGAVTLYSDEACTAGTEVGEEATDVLTVYARGESVGTATVTVTATNGTDDTADDKSASCDVTVNRKGQNITAEDVSVTYGDTGTAVSATTDGDGALRYEVKEGADVIDVDAESGALTIKRAGTATVIVTAAETSTCAQATKDVDVTVNKAGSRVTKAPTATNPTYDGKAHPLVTAGTAEGGTMRYSLDGESFSDEVPTGTDGRERLPSEDGCVYHSRDSRIRFCNPLVAYCRIHCIHMRWNGGVTWQP